MTAASPQEIASNFGEEFAAQIDEAPVGQWSGPIESGFGLHLVKVDERTAGKTPTLAEIRPIVLREWQSEERRRQNQALLDALKSKYEVRIEGPAAELYAAASAGTAR
jgi:parvulin-like peptidyl-prolyl isomerase